MGDDLLERVCGRVVGRRRELETIVAALNTGRHLLLEGPPGTGKSTVLRAIATERDTPFEFVEGNAELTPARLVGSFDPSIVLSEGYVADAFADGALLSAMRSGGLLYIEEINRVPEETLNVLITVMSEGELHVPRLGRVGAAGGFRLVAAMNPFDAIGTARIASAVYDRCCRLAMDYQDERDEQSIVASATRSPLPDPLVAAATAMVRDSRSHADVRTGSSVRGAIDLVLLVNELASIRGVGPDTGSGADAALGDAAVTLDAALLALSGRVRVREGSSRTAEDIVTELWQRHLAPRDPEPTTPEASSDGASSPGKA